MDCSHALKDEVRESDLMDSNFKHPNNVIESDLRPHPESLTEK
jgi:hypothetical protein